MIRALTGSWACSTNPSPNTCYPSAWVRLLFREGSEDSALGSTAQTHLPTDPSFQYPRLRDAGSLAGFGQKKKKTDILLTLAQTSRPFSRVIATAERLVCQCDVPLSPRRAAVIRKHFSKAPQLAARPGYRRSPAHPGAPTRHLHPPDGSP
jgi:hypothetical protein